MGRKKLPRQEGLPGQKELPQAWGRGKSADGCCQANRPRHGCRPKRNAAALLPARQRPDRQGSAAALLWCIRPHFSVGPTAAGPPCPPPFPNSGGLPGRPVGGGVFSSPGAQTSPCWGARGGRSLEAFFLRAPGTCPGQNDASKGGKAGRIAKNRKGSRRTGCRPEEEQRKDGARPKRGASPLWRTWAAADACLGRRMPEPGGCRLLWQRLSRQPFRAGWPAAGAPSGGGRLVRRPSAEVCADGPARRPDAALLPDGGSRCNGRGGYAQLLPRAVLL